MKTPRVMIAAVKSGSGKTTITCALLQQLLQRGRRPVSFKCGPDYIDPMFHQQLLGIPSRNLDPFFSTEDQLKALFLIDQSGDEISVIEGVMGLYDGLGGIREEGSSYQLAELLETPIILVVDAHGMGRSVIPLLAGFLQYDRKHLIRGVILNRMSSMFLTSIAPEIERETGIRVYGCFPQQTELNLKSRHLGLVMPEEIAGIRETLEAAGKALDKNTAVDEIIALAESAGELDMQRDAIREQLPGETGRHSEDRVRIAVARDEAFCFYYRDNFRILEQLGAELVFFSPLHDRELPENIQGLILGGGYPEEHAQELSDNTAMRAAVAGAIQRGIPSIAECGGFMYLHEQLIDATYRSYPMVGCIPAKVQDTGKLVRFGYIELKEKNPVFLSEHTMIKGHEFHYYDSSANGAACLAQKPVTGRSWECIHENERSFWGFPHLYYASNPAFAEHFMKECRKMFV